MVPNPHLPDSAVGGVCLVIRAMKRLYARATRCPPVGRAFKDPPACGTKRRRREQNPLPATGETATDAASTSRVLALSKRKPGKALLNAGNVNG